MRSHLFGGFGSFVCSWAVGSPILRLHPLPPSQSRWEPGDLQARPLLATEAGSVLSGAAGVGAAPLFSFPVCLPGTAHAGCSHQGLGLLRGSSSAGTVRPPPTEGTPSGWPARTPHPAALGLGEESVGGGGTHSPLGPPWPPVWHTEAHAPSRVFTVIHIHEMLAQILPPLGIHMKPFFRTHFFLS